MSNKCLKCGMSFHTGSCNAKYATIARLKTENIILRAEVLRLMAEAKYMTKNLRLGSGDMLKRMK